MESLDNLKQIIGNEGLKILYDSVVTFTSNSEALFALKKINKELNRLKSNLELLFKQLQDSDKISNKSNRNHQDSQTDMLGLLHPNGQFVNLYYGNIKDVVLEDSTLKNAVCTYKQNYKDEFTPEINEEIISGNENCLPKRGRKKRLLKPYAMTGENINKNDDKLFTIPQAHVNGKIESLNHNKNQIDSDSKNDTKNNLFTSVPITLKCGQKITVLKSKLTPVPKEAFIRQIKNTNTSERLENDLFNDDTLSVASSFDVSDLAEYLDGRNDHFEQNITDSGSANKNDPGSADKKSMMYSVYKCWKYCDVLDSNGHALIHKAVLNNDLRLLKLQCLALQSKRKNISLRDGQNRSPLEISILSESDISVIQTLLQHGGRIEETNPDTGNNLLHLAMLHTENLQIIKFLVEKSHLSILCKCNDSGFTPLHLAVRKSNANVHRVKILLSNQHMKKFLDIPDLSSGKTALFHAMEGNNREIVRLLLQKGADPNISTLSGNVLTESYFDLDISNALRQDFRHYLRLKEMKIGKRISTEEAPYISKRLLLEKQYFNPHKKSTEQF